MKYNLFLCSIFFIVFIWSAINPYEYFTWILEVFPAILGIIVLWWTYKKFPLTKFLYTLILIHSIILFVWGHYTYAEVPLFHWIAEVFWHTRNNYDKVWHFAQWFVPVFIAREIFIRRFIINGKYWVAFLSVTCCLAFSAFYELLEWAVSVWTGSAWDSFLGTQWYVWDTQSDMFYALIGAIIWVVFFGKLHDRYIEKLKNK